MTKRRCTSTSPSPELVEALQTDIAWVRRHTEYGEAAEHWAAGGRSGGLLLALAGARTGRAVDRGAPRSNAAPADRDDAPLHRREPTRRDATAQRSHRWPRRWPRRRPGAGRPRRSGNAAIAVTQQARAERNFNAAKSTVDTVVVDIADGLKDVEGMKADTVRRILDRAEAAVDKLAADTSGDRQIRYSQGAMYTLFAETYLRVGATDMASAYAKKSEDTFRPLLAERPDNVELQLDMAHSLGAEGDVLLEAHSDSDAALAVYRRGLDLARGFTAKRPDDDKLQRDLAALLERVGNALLRKGDPAGAFAVYNESLAIARALVAESPSDQEGRRNLGISLNKIGDVLRAEGDVAGALAVFREAVDNARAVYMAKDPANTRWRRDLSAGLSLRRQHAVDARRRRRGPRRLSRRPRRSPRPCGERRRERRSAIQRRDVPPFRRRSAGGQRRSRRRCRRSSAQSSPHSKRQLAGEDPNPAELQRIIGFSPQLHRRRATGAGLPVAGDWNPQQAVEAADRLQRATLNNLDLGGAHLGGDLKTLGDAPERRQGLCGWRAGGLSARPQTVLACCRRCSCYGMAVSVVSLTRPGGSRRLRRWKFVLPCALRRKLRRLAGAGAKRAERIRAVKRSSLHGGRGVGPLDPRGIRATKPAQSAPTRKASCCG